MRRCRSLALSSTAIAGIWLCWLISIRAETTGLFHPDAQHISNRLYRELHVRKEPNGKEHGCDALDPLLWSRTSYLLDGKSWAQALGLADEFLRTHAERQISDRTKRAMLQRDVWAIFDWADQSDLPHQTERRELIARLAPIVKRLALSPDELAQLPDTYVRALQNHEFPAAYDPANPSQAFLPPDLFDTRGPWVCLGAPDHDLAAPLHDLSFTARSIFFVFARLPGGRAATLTYFKQLAEMKLSLFVRMQEPGWPQPMDVWNPKVPQFPVGTEYPMASCDVALAQRFQAVSEIDLSRMLLFSEHHSGLRAVTATDDHFLIFPAMSQGFDAFEENTCACRLFHRSWNVRAAISDQAFNP